MAVLLYLLLLLAAKVHSTTAIYCICKDGLSDSALQKTLDYACGAGADCSAILQNGACYNPNTVKDHCSYAANSYFQKKGQTQGSCDFAGTAQTSSSPPSNVASGCVYQATPSTGSGTTTPTGSPTTPTNGPTTPNTGTTPGINTPTPSSTSTTPTTFTPGVLGPTGSGTGIGDNSGATAAFAGMNLFFCVSLALVCSGPFLLWA